MRALIATSFLAAALAFPGCAAGIDQPLDGESTEGASAALSTYGHKLVGAWKVQTSGSFEIDALVLESTGKFFWHRDIVCKMAPCPTGDAGSWAGYAPAKGQVQGRIVLTSKTEVRHYGVVIGGDGTIKLSRPGASAKFDNVGTYCQTVDQCNGQPDLIMVRCVGGYHSEPVCTDTNSCSKNCVKDKVAAPCLKTGCSGQLCADSAVVTTCEYRAEYACYATATCERDAAGKCGFRATSELTSCLANGGVSCNYASATKSYVGKSADECSRIRFICTTDKHYFSDACGCGCENN